MDELIEVLNNDAIGKVHDEDDPLTNYLFSKFCKRFTGSVITPELIKLIDAKKKKLPQACGNFWQKRFGEFPGWEDLKTGHESGCDLKNEELGVIMELKNKYNTMNSTSMNATIQKLKRQEGYKRRVIGIINGRGHDIRIVGDGMVEIIQGKELFRLVTGNPEYMNVVLEELEVRTNKTQTVARYGLSDACRDFSATLLKSCASVKFIRLIA